jgi:hypothetical protein
MWPMNTGGHLGRFYYTLLYCKLIIISQYWLFGLSKLIWTSKNQYGGNSILLGSYIVVRS